MEVYLSKLGEPVQKVESDKDTVVWVYSYGALDTVRVTVSFDVNSKISTGYAWNVYESEPEYSREAYVRRNSDLTFLREVDKKVYDHYMTKDVYFKNEEHGIRIHASHLDESKVDWIAKSFGPSRIPSNK